MTGFQEYELLEPGAPPAEDTGIKRHFRKGGLANDTAWGALHDVSQLIVMTATFTLLGRSLGDAGYGRYAGLYGIVGPIGGLTWSGICLCVLQRRLREGDDIATVARKVTLMSLTLGLVGLAIGTLVGAATIGGTLVVTVTAVMFAELVANGVNQVLFAMVQAEKGFAIATRLRMVVLAIRVTTVLTLFTAGRLSVDPGATAAEARDAASHAIGYLAGGYSIGFLVYLAVLITTILPRHGIPFVLRRPDASTTKLTAQFSLPIAVGVLQQDGDKTVLNSYGYHAEAGLYAAAFRVVAMGLMPLRALEGAAFQRFLPHNENERNEHTRRAFRYSVLALGISLVIGVGIFICTPLISVILGDDFAKAEAIVPWLLPFLPLTAVSNAPSNGLLGLGKLGVRFGIYAAGAVVSLTLYITMIPLMPAGEPWKGAVIGTIAGEAFLTIAGWVALRHYQKRHNATLDAPPNEPSPGSWADPQPPPPYVGPPPVHQASTPQDR